ncbi:MAG: DUF3047 domain-containing protein [Deltaproteobacteria bacterium]|nr:DUF3047 domain-containing protein [Deltaproteobacteria bacterium]
MIPPVVRTVLLTLLLGFSLLPVKSVSAGDFLLIDDFSKDLSGWEAKVFSGKNDYRLVPDGNNNQVLRAASNNSASALIHKVDIDPARYPRLSWRWKVSGIIKKGDARKKATDDYAARIYVIFPHWFKPLTRSLNYIWANKLKKDSFIPNSYFSGAVMIAVESGDRKVGKWQVEERNLVEDFRRVFGEDPPTIGGIAIMTDTDQTGESVLAWYDDIKLLKAD